MMYEAGLVLEGGSTRGIFTSGALDYLLEKDMEFSYVVGVSAGSCNAVDFVSKQFDRTRHCFMPERENDYMTVGAILKKHSIFDMDIIFDKYPKDIYPFDFDTYFSSETVCEIVATNAADRKSGIFSGKSGQGTADEDLPGIVEYADDYTDGGCGWRILCGRRCFGFGTSGPCDENGL